MQQTTVTCIDIVCSVLEKHIPIIATYYGFYILYSFFENKLYSRVIAVLRIG